ncbi:MAG: glycoside hydrolase family 3 C-terminal domain-containing protein, partial [Bacillales bacterium]
MIQLVCEQFDKTIVLLNVASIIDMKWVEKYDPAAVLYVWQGGQEGGNGVLDVLNGTHSPSGKLTDTIAYDLSDYPSTPYFGDAKRNIYVEDIYVGYRYFETFAKDKVLYPFGFGLSYTSFSIAVDAFHVSEDMVSVQVTVTNTGEHHGKEVVQMYVEAPQGKLGKPLRSLCAFAKTKTLQPGESQQLTLSCSKKSLASYDDSGITGHKSCYVLEEGTYFFHVGNSVRHTTLAGSFEVDTIQVTERLTEALSPVVAFERMKPVILDSGEIEVGYEPVPLRSYSLQDRIEKNRPKAIPYTGDQGWKLSDVADGKVSLEEFIAQL